MRPGDVDLGTSLDAKLQSFEHEVHSLPGLQTSESRAVLVSQVVESIRRIKFVSVIRSRELSNLRSDPASETFDPIRASIIQRRRGNTEEAFWLVFLFVHFGKHPRAGYRYTREIYGRLGEGGQWNWPTVSNNVTEFRSWLHSHQEQLRRNDAHGGFGNHRKYESLDALSANGTGAVVESYVNWVRPQGTHEHLFSRFCDEADGDAQSAFSALFRSMSAVARFGRTAKFDYLAMVGKLELAEIEPDSAHLAGSTGPLRGAKLLFGDTLKLAELELLASRLASSIGVGMQAIEDALCNWQKSPAKFVAFRG